MAKQASSVHALDEKPPFGSRFLTEDQDIWSQNAWDHVEPPTERLAYVDDSLQRQRASRVPPSDFPKYHDKPSRHWDNFYKTNTANFFKDRRWLHLEFPELTAATQENSGEVVILEVGCGAGNAAFPILNANQNPGLRLVACDYSHRAVALVQSNPSYTSPHVGEITSQVWDLTSDLLPDGIDPGSVDFVIMIFVLSALHPNEWQKAILNVHKLLKPGGMILFRDYGRHDLTQVRFKEGRLLQENFYIRGDKTRVYFFDLDDLASIFTGSRLPSSVSVTIAETTEECGESSQNGTADDRPSELQTKSNSNERTLNQESRTPLPPNEDALFTIETIGIDRRLLVNRKRMLKMYRVWMQAKFRKRGDGGLPASTEQSGVS